LACSHDGRFVARVVSRNAHFGFRESISAAGMRLGFGSMHPPEGMREGCDGSERVRCPGVGRFSEAMSSGSLCLSFVSMRVKRGERETHSERDWLCVAVYGRIGGRCVGIH